MKTSVDKEAFKQAVENLREILNKVKEEGQLPNDFEGQLQALLEIEGQLLRDLVPIYRLSSEQSHQTKLSPLSLKAMGAYGMDDFWHRSIQVGEDLFLISRLDGKLQTFRLQEEAKKPKYIEWGPELSGISETIDCFYPLNHHQILMISIEGNIYMGQVSSWADCLSDPHGLEIRPLACDLKVKGLQRCIALGQLKFLLIDNNDEKLLIKIIEKEGLYDIQAKRIESGNELTWTALEPMSNDRLVIGEEDGTLAFIDYSAGQWQVYHREKLFDGAIKCMGPLQNEVGLLESLMVIGDKGQVSIVKLKEQPIKICPENRVLDEYVVDIQAQNGTAVVLSETGKLYFFEENLDQWFYLPEATLENLYYTHVIPWHGQYFGIDVQGDFQHIKLDRINTPQALWESELYK